MKRKGKGKSKRKNIHERLEEISERALTRLEELVQSDQAGLALKACDSVLDRNPETARNQRVESDLRAKFQIDPVTLMHAAMTAKELDELPAKPNGGEHVLPAQQREGEPLSGDESGSRDGQSSSSRQGICEAQGS
jgi:hypothetical protein